MAIIIKTTDPAGLLRKIKAAIDAKTIVTWSYDADGDFTHETDQWRRKAWLRPKQDTNELRFGIIGPKGVTLTKTVRGVYHGRFIEMLVTHFDKDFTTAAATAQKTEPDLT